MGFDPMLLVVPSGSAPSTQRLVVRATSFIDRSVRGTLRLRLPAGWTSSPASAPLSVTSAGDSATAHVRRDGAGAHEQAGVVIVSAEAAVGGRVFSSARADVCVSAHPEASAVYSPAGGASRGVRPRGRAGASVGYIMGSGDEVPDALRRMGVDVTMIDREMLATGDLSRFDTIVVGVRASEARPDFVAEPRRGSRAYMERGGTLVVQYQQTDYVESGSAAVPGEVARQLARDGRNRRRSRILVPRIRSSRTPTSITSADFDGWVQERNLYSFGSFDARYTALFESADPGEAPQRGGEVHRRCRQREVRLHVLRVVPTAARRSPGAYRQFANLISLPKAPWRCKASARRRARGRYPFAVPLRREVPRSWIQHHPDSLARAPREPRRTAGPDRTAHARLHRRAGSAGAS